MVLFHYKLCQLCTSIVHVLFFASLFVFPAPFQLHHIYGTCLFHYLPAFCRGACFPVTFDNSDFVICFMQSYCPLPTCFVQRFCCFLQIGLFPCCLHQMVTLFTCFMQSYFPLPVCFAQSFCHPHHLITYPIIVLIFLLFPSSLMQISLPTIFVVLGYFIDLPHPPSVGLILHHM